MTAAEESGKTAVFLSWSGPRSKALALVLRDYLENMIQSVQPYMSERDIGAGEVWDSKLTEMIRAAKFGVACVTPENAASTWLHFEAGALSNAVAEEKRLCPCLLGIKKTDLRPPLSRFQAKEPTETDTLALTEAINSLCASPLTAERLRTAFSKYWPDLRAAITAIEQPDPSSPPARTSEDKLDEILSISRDLARASAQPTLLHGWSPGTMRPDFIARTGGLTYVGEMKGKDTSQERIAELLMGKLTPEPEKLG